MMKRFLWAVTAVAVTGLFGPAPADAQELPDYKFSFGIFGGGSAYTSMLDDEHLGTEEDVRHEWGWLTGAQATFWPMQWLGIRANGAYTERPIVTGGIFSPDDPPLVSDGNIWTATGDLLFRFAPDGFGTGNFASMPYLALGAGAKYFDQPGDVLLAGTAGGDDELLGRSFTAPGGNDFAVVEEWQLAGRVAVGTDFRFSDMFGMRLELGDVIYDAPLRNFPIPADQDEDVGNVVHELYATLGAHVLLGLVEPEVVAVAPTPPPPPAPEPEPEPEPEPVEERIRVCVIDPTTEMGITTVDAIYLPETRDTMVVVNGVRRDFDTVVPNVMVANEADWFVRGEPLTVQIADDATIEYTTWQSARMIEADRLTFLGTSRGLPVYASTDDVRDIRNEWMEARRAAMSDDLDDILDERAELAAELEEVQYLYVPLRPTGCVFQTVRIVEQVRKK